LPADPALQFHGLIINAEVPMWENTHRIRGRPGFDVGIEAAQGMPRTRSPRKSILETLQTPTTSVLL
jgi:hypothetical protein